MTRVVVTKDAELDIAKINAWYETNQPLNASRLDRALTALEGSLGAFPRLYPVVHGEVRRAPMPRLPYLAWYIYNDKTDTVTILAVSHFRQDRGALLNRIS